MYEFLKDISPFNIGFCWVLILMFRFSHIGRSTSDTFLALHIWHVPFPSQERWPVVGLYLSRCFWYLYVQNIDAVLPRFMYICFICSGRSRARKKKGLSVLVVKCGNHRPNSLVFLWYSTKKEVLDPWLLYWI